MHKIFVDFNNCDSRNRVRLNTTGSMDDLHAMGVEPFEGLEVLLDDDDGLCVLGALEFSKEENIWVAIPNTEL